MRYYELLYIVNPNYEDERVNAIIDEIGKEIDKHKASIINHHIWGKKRLAYTVKNNKYGIYLLLQFGTDKFDFLKELERILILNKSVIRHQLIRLEDEPQKVEKLEEVIVETEPLDEEVFDVPDEIELTKDVEEAKEDVKENAKEDAKEDTTDGSPQDKDTGESDSESEIKKGDEE